MPKAIATYGQRPPEDKSRHRVYAKYRGPEAKGYNTAAWRRLRAMKLARNPLCEDCEAKGHATPADMVHHLDETRDGHPVLCPVDRLVSLCNPCHQQRHRSRT